MTTPSDSSLPTRFRMRLNRRQLLGGSAALATGAVLPTVVAPAAQALELPPRKVPEGAQEPGSVEGSLVTRHGNVTGPGRTTKYQMERTDIGIPVRAPSGRTLVVFGDSYAGWQGGEQMSPTALWAEPDQPYDRLLEWSGAVGGDVATELVAPYRGGVDPSVGTKLPSDVLTVGDTMYMQLWAVNPFPDLVRTEIWKSTDDGESWQDTGVQWNKEFQDRAFWLWTWEAHDDGYAYIYSQVYRGKQLFLWRVPLDRIEDQNAYEPWGFNPDDGWKWGLPASPIREAEVGFGEGALRRFGDKWMYTSVIDGKLQAFLLDEPWSNMQAAQPVTLLEGANYEDESATRMSQLYLGGIIPGGTLEDFTMLVSQWAHPPEMDEISGWPYWVEHFRFQNFF